MKLRCPAVWSDLSEEHKRLWSQIGRLDVYFFETILGCKVGTHCLFVWIQLFGSCEKIQALPVYKFSINEKPGLLSHCNKPYFCCEYWRCCVAVVNCSWRRLKQSKILPCWFFAWLKHYQDIKVVEIVCSTYLLGALFADSERNLKVSAKYFGSKLGDLWKKTRDQERLENHVFSSELV